MQKCDGNTRPDESSITRLITISIEFDQFDATVRNLESMCKVSSLLVSIDMMFMFIDCNRSRYDITNSNSIHLFRRRKLFCIHIFTHTCTVRIRNATSSMKYSFARACLCAQDDFIILQRCVRVWAYGISSETEESNKNKIKHSIKLNKSQTPIFISNFEFQLYINVFESNSMHFIGFESSAMISISSTNGVEPLV